MNVWMRATLLALLLFGSMLSQASADWAANFVVFNGGMYTVTEEEVATNAIGEQIGQVTRYSDREGTYGGNFSNRFPVGTPYYAILGAGEHKRIAVKTEDGTFVAAIYTGRYGADASVWTAVPVWMGVIAVVLGVALAAWRLAAARSGRGGGV